MNNESHFTSHEKSDDVARIEISSEPPYNLSFLLVEGKEPIKPIITLHPDGRMTRFSKDSEEEIDLNTDEIRKGFLAFLSAVTSSSHPLCRNCSAPMVCGNKDCEESVKT
jgi:hypothetical protein